MMMATTLMMATWFDTTTRFPPRVQPGKILPITWTVTTTGQPRVQCGVRIPPVDSTPLGSTIPTYRPRYGKVIPTRRLRPTIRIHRPLLTTLTTPTHRLHGKVIVTRVPKDRKLIHGQVTITRRQRNQRQRNQLQDLL